MRITIACTSCGIRNATTKMGGLEREWWCTPCVRMVLAQYIATKPTRARKRGRR